MRSNPVAFSAYQRVTATPIVLSFRPVSEATNNSENVRKYTPPIILGDLRKVLTKKAAETTGESALILV